jgi:hypothetical protein
VEEIPPAGDAASGPVPLARLEPGSPGGAAPAGELNSRTLPGHAGASEAAGALRPADAGVGGGTSARPPRIVVYRRPLMARADSEDDLGELVFEVIVEEFARLLGMSPEDVDPGYPGED